MKKTTTLVMAGGLMLLLAACGQKSATTPAAENKTTPAEQAQPASGGVISSIKDAMGLGKKMECTYKSQVGDKTLESKTWVNGKQTRSEMDINGKKQISIFDGTTIYSWQEETKTGTKFTIECMKEVSQSLPQGQQPQQQMDPENPDANATEVSCVPAGDVDFTVPSDVTFTDQCEMMKNLIQNMPKTPNVPNMPKNIPNYPGQ